MMDTALVRACDPHDEAPPLVESRDQGADQVGHGRILPLVGGVRPYVYDVVFRHGSQRVYADSPDGALCALIEGYEPFWEDWKAASSVIEDLELRGESGTPEQQAAAEDAYYALCIARMNYADDVRRQLQQRENENAQAQGGWDNLTDEERTQCTAGAATTGPPPIGVLVEMPWDDNVTIEAGVWETTACKLVINRGDYGIWDPDGTPEPEATHSEVDPETGEEIVVVTEWPINMVILDPTTAWTLLDSLERADRITIDVRPADLPDEFYTDAVELGRSILDNQD